MNDDPTIDYYDRNAEEYAAATFAVDTAELRERFTSLLSEGARILDAGCGSGRDARAFLDSGFDVAALEPSAKLASIATRNTGIDVVVGRFQEIAWRGEFDGIWACASLLHVPPDEMALVIARLADALRAGGILYASFKIAEESYPENGRRFTVVSSETWNSLCVGASLTVIDEWISSDQKHRDGVNWLNFLSRKEEDETRRECVENAKCFGNAKCKRL